jgi:hypothetical protein
MDQPPLPAVVAECGTLCVIPAYVPERWYSRLYAVIDEKGTHICMGGWNNGEGHAKCRMAGKATYAYRWVYQHVTGRRLARFDYIDHLCERKPCITFEHLEPTTPGENVYRGPGRDTQYRAPSHYGDPLDDIA